MPQSIPHVLDEEVCFKHGSDEVTCMMQTLQKICIIFWAKVALLQWTTGLRGMGVSLPDLIPCSPPLSRLHTYGAPEHWAPCWSSSSASTLPPLPLCSGSCLSLDCSPVRYLHGQLPRLIQSVQISLPKSHLWEAYLKLQGLRILDSEAPLTAFFPSLSSFHSTYDPLVHYIIYFSIVSCLILLLEWKLHQGRVFFVLLFCINGSPMPRTVPWI